MTGIPFNMPNVPTGPLTRGVFLVALPPLQDPNFRQSVIYMCEVGKEGAMGLIINRPTDLQLSEALPEEELLSGTDMPVHSGGPVQDDRILLLRRGGTETDDFTTVEGDISLGGTLDALKEAATTTGIMGTFRPFRGYAGWGAGQLEAELEQHAWAVLPGDSDRVFSQNTATMWQEMMAEIGGALAIYSTMPPDVTLN